MFLASVRASVANVMRARDDDFFTRTKPQNQIGWKYRIPWNNGAGRMVFVKPTQKDAPSGDDFVLDDRDVANLAGSARDVWGRGRGQRVEGPSLRQGPANLETLEAHPNGHGSSRWTMRTEKDPFVGNKAMVHWLGNAERPLSFDTVHEAPCPWERFVFGTRIGSSTSGRMDAVPMHV